MCRLIGITVYEGREEVQRRQIFASGLYMLHRSSSPVAHTCGDLSKADHKVFNRRLSFLRLFSLCTASSKGISSPLDCVFWSSRSRMLTDRVAFSSAPTTTRCQYNQSKSRQRDNLTKYEIVLLQLTSTNFLL